jgi:hypothetical protein
MEVIVVKMNRFGDRELHSYILGVFSDRLSAEAAGREETERRGGKYEAEYLKFHVVRPLIDVD